MFARLGLSFSWYPQEQPSFGVETAEELYHPAQSEGCRHHGKHDAVGEMGLKPVEVWETGMVVATDQRTRCRRLQTARFDAEEVPHPLNLSRISRKPVVLAALDRA